MGRAAAHDGDRPVLVLVSEHPERFDAVRAVGREVHQWRRRMPDGAPSAPGRLFAGDPGRPETYGAIPAASREAVAVIDLGGSIEAAAAVRALREAIPEAAVLVVSREGEPPLPAGIAARQVRWSELALPDLVGEIEWLDTQRRVRRLEAFAAGARVLPVLVQDEPDPDAIASALAVRVLLGRRAASCPIVSLGRVGRPENRRMLELLRLRVTQVTADELRGLDRLVAVDTQPTEFAGGPTRLAVIDHHPPDAACRAEFADVRPEFGAAATLLTEYLRAHETRRIGRRVATALLYGIQTDTALLTRGATARDVKAYAFLQGLADLALLRRVARPLYRPDAVRAFGRALVRLEVDDDLAAAYLGRVAADRAHLVVDLADFCLSLEGVNWVVVGARVDGELILTLRHLGSGPGAGVLARRLAGEDGEGGGHPSMARVALPAGAARRRLGRPAAAGVPRALARMVRAALLEEGG